MPVSLSEWRVRIGTFVHWIREYEVKESRERLLKERIRRLKVLCERLEAKIGDSGEESEDDKSGQDDPGPKGCPHKTLNIRSSGNSSDIKNLLTSCDQCIHDLLTASDSHIKEILTPSDTCIKQLLTPRRERLQRIQRLKVLCERLEAKMGDSGEESEDDKSRQDDPDPKGCPHKTLNIRSSGNSSDIKNLLNSCDQCTQDLLTASDSHIKEILAPSDTCIKQLLTPTDSKIRHLLSLTNLCRKDQQTACDSHNEDISMLTPNDSNIRELIIHSDSCFRELHMSADACTDDMLSDSDVKDLLTPKDSAIFEILQPKDYCTNMLLTPRGSYTQMSLIPRDSCIQELLTPRDSYIRELLSVNSHADRSLTPGDGYIQEMFTPRDTYTSESLTTGDFNIQELLTQKDSYIQDLLTPRDSYSIEPHTQGDSYIQELLTPRDSYTNESLTPEHFYTNTSLNPGDSYIQKLITPSDFYTNESLTPGDSCTQDFLTPRNSDVRELLTPIDSYTIEPLTQGDSYIQELFTPTDSYADEQLRPGHSFTNTSLTQGDSYIHELLSLRDSYTNESPTPGDSCIQELFTPRDSHTNELLTPTASYANELLTLGDSYIHELLTPRDSHTNELMTPTDSYTNKLLTPGNSFTNTSLSPGDSYIHELLAPRDSYTHESLTCTQDFLSHTCSDTRELLTHSYTIEPLTQGDSYIQELLTPTDSYPNMLLTPGHSVTNTSLTPGDSYIHEFLEPRDSYANKSLTPGDSSTQDFLSPRDSDIQELLTIVDCSTNESLAREDLYIHELLTPGHSYTKLTQGDSYIHKLLTPRDSYANKLLRPADYYANLTLTPIDSNTNESRTPGHSFTNESLTPGDSYIQSLLTSRISDIRQLLAPRDFYTNESLAQGDSSIQELLTPTDSYTNEPLTPGHSYTDKSLTGVKLEPPRQGDNNKSHTSSLYSDAVQHGPFGGKEMANTSSRSKSPCHKTDSLKGSADVMLSQQPYLTELLLVKAGDVELNPGPLHSSTDSVLQEIELIRLAEEVPGDCYYKLCIGLGFSLTQSKNLLTQHHLNFPGALIEIFCGWKIKQRDGTDCRALLGEILQTADMGALQTKLLKGEYLPSGTSPSEPILDTSEPNMTEAQVLQCGEDLKTFYREQMCKIKPDPLDFNIILEFEQIYTNLTLLRKETGTKENQKPQEYTEPLKYTDLLTTEVNGVFPKRLLVEGEGGVGKTTFCSKIAWDWVNESTEFQRFTWVLVIPLREFVKGQTIGDIMKNYLSDSNAVNPKQIDNYILTQPTKVLIVLDGLDEYDGDLSAKDSSDISQILRLEKFKECIVLVTSRPWSAAMIKSNKELSKLYAFIAVKGFSAENVSTYIRNYFVNDEKAGSELRQFIKVNDVIEENMAPFPIYVAMLCILWENCDNEKRETIRRLKTFSQLFEQMIMFLRDHYVSKVAKVLNEAHLEKEMENINLCLQRIGSIAFSGLLIKKLVFNKEDFSLCKEAMETCCRIGVLSRENRNVSRWKRTLTASQPIITIVFFPHKLFQEYLASVYLASLYDTNCEEYSRTMDQVLSKNPQEFRYLLYFTAARGSEMGLDIVKKISQRGSDNNFLADVTFEAYNKDTAKAVGQGIFADERILTIDKNMPAHTTSGYLFIMEQHGMETLIFRDRSCGPTVSRDLADVLFTSKSLRSLEFYYTTLHLDFYKLMDTQVYTMAIQTFKVDHLDLRDDQLASCCLGKFVSLLPHLTDLKIHSCSLHDDFYKEIANRASLSQIRAFNVYDLKLNGDQSASYCLGKFLILLPHIKELKIHSCSLHDDFYKEIANRASLCQIQTFQVDYLNLRDDQPASVCLGKFVSLLPHLTDLDIISCPFHDDFYKEIADRASSSQIQTFKVDYVYLRQDQSASYCLGKFIRLLPHLTDLNIRKCPLHDDFFKEIADQTSSSQIQTLKVDGLDLLNDQSASYCLGKFLSHLPHLTDLNIHSCSLHDGFYKEIADRASSSQIQTVSLHLRLILSMSNEVLSHSASKQLAKFLCSLPCLANLAIDKDEYLDGCFFTELRSLAASSQSPYFREKTVVNKKASSAISSSTT